jgi:hypothetical protein
VLGEAGLAREVLQLVERSCAALVVGTEEGEQEEQEQNEEVGEERGEGG